MTTIQYSETGVVLSVSREQGPVTFFPIRHTHLNVPDEVGSAVMENPSAYVIADGVLERNGVPVEIVPPIPASVSPLQARKALRQAGVLALVAAALEAADEETQEAWEYATEIRRDNPLVCGVASSVGMTHAQVDDLFRLAGTL
jgi:hypothetical protein